MLFIIISAVTSIIAGSGIGGGSIYIMLIIAFNLMDYKTAIVYNLIMFVIVGITATINNIKNKKFDKKLFVKIIVTCLIGSYIGVHFAKVIDEQYIKRYFYYFILIMGIYEIISSLISFKREKI